MTLRDVMFKIARFFERGYDVTAVYLPQDQHRVYLASGGLPVIETIVGPVHVYPAWGAQMEASWTFR